MTSRLLRRSVPVAVAVALPLALLPAGVAHAWGGGGFGGGGFGGGGTGNNGNTQACPAPQSLVAGTNWTWHTLAPGVKLQEGDAADDTVSGEAGTVNIHVLHITPASANVKFAPLEDHIAQRTELSQLAANRSKLVAATNTGYFDFDADAPEGPEFADGFATSIGSSHKPVIGFTKTNTVESASAWLSGGVTVAKTTKTVSGFNYLNPTRGLAVYTSAWGTNQVPFAPSRHNDNTSVVLRDGQVAVKAGSTATAPSTGYLLVASTPKTEKWLESLRVGQQASLNLRVASNAAKPLVEAYATGVQIVSKADTVDTSLGCNENNTQAARTGIGYNAKGHLIIAVVADHIGTTEHGLDHKEMSKLMVDLGAVRAWEWDGSGSSEMIARLPGAALTVRNWCADGNERAMPVGFGVYSYPNLLKGTKSKTKGKSKKKKM